MHLHLLHFRLAACAGLQQHHDDHDVDAIKHDDIAMHDSRSKLRLQVGICAVDWHMEPCVRVCGRMRRMRSAARACAAQRL